MKAYTDLEQSKKLGEILPHESADLMWEYEPNKDTYRNKPMMIPIESYIFINDIPCWSLAALIEIIPWAQVNRMTNSYKWEASSWINSNIVSEYHVEGFDTAVDACYELLLKLHELNLLRL